MDTSAERVFDDIGKAYEAAFAHNPGLHKIIERTLAILAPGSQILDVGCGTGIPVSHAFANAGHNVSGIDVSQEMIDIARKQVNGSFEKADMRTYQPTHQFDAIFAVLSLFLLSKSELSSMVLKFSEWLRPGGFLVIVTIHATSAFTDRSMYDETGECIDTAEAEFMGHSFKVSLFTTRGWHDLIEKVGMDVEFTQSYSFKPDSEICEKEDQYYIVAKRTARLPLLGPYPLPEQYRGPYSLDREAFRSFTKRLSLNDYNAVLEEVKENKMVLDISRGYNGLPSAIAQRHGHAYFIEADANESKTIAAGSQMPDVEALSGILENLPFPDNSFDAVASMWVLNYAQNLEKSLQEMARIVDPSLPNAKIVLVQGTPDNEVINMVNRTCVPLSVKNKTPNHEGYILSKASEIFRTAGFTDITLRRVNVCCEFAEEDISTRCVNAAKVLAALWFKEDPNLARMEQELLPVLNAHFERRHHSIGHDGVILVARPPSGAVVGNLGQ